MTCCATLQQTADVQLVSSRPARLRHRVDPALTIKAGRDGPVRTLILRGELGLCEVSELLQQAAIAVDGQTERLVLDLGGLTFLDCVGARALAMVASFAPPGCPVIIRSLNPEVRRLLELLRLDLENPAVAGYNGKREGDSRQPGRVIRGVVPLA